MRLSDVDVAVLTEKASNLGERISGDFALEADTTGVATRRLERWRKVTGGDPERFTRILAAIGVSDASESGLLSLLGPVRQRSEMTKPAWAAMLEEIVQSTSAATDATLPKRWKATRMPYAALFEPTVLLARCKVEESTIGVASRLSDEAWSDLQEHLLRRMSEIASAALHARFLARNAVLESGMMMQFFGSASRVGTNAPNSLYSSFVLEEREDGLRSFFMQYPTAGRLVAEITLNWIDTVQEFLQRMENDRSELASHFDERCQTGEALTIKAGLSDPHRRGRTVFIVTFAKGLTLVYKPRSMEIDKLYFEFLGELNKHLGVSQLRRLKVLNRSDHGWMEFARHSACSSEAGAKHFFRRAGTLISVVHWLGGIDCHRENLVAAGNDPVLVDLESLSQPSWPGEDLQEVAYIADSVLRTGLLPLPESDLSGSRTFDHSALGAPARQRSLFRVARWQHVNTDQMQLSFEKREHFHAEHVPTLAGRRLAIQNYEEQVLHGFRQTCSILESARGRTFAHWQDLFYRTLRRRIKRPTAVYGILKRRSVRPENLANGIDRSIELHALPLGDEEMDGEHWRQEIASLEGLDVPYFQFKTGTAPRPRCKTKCEVETIRLSLRQSAPKR